jgi:hypothetical protein
LVARSSDAEDGKMAKDKKVVSLDRELVRDIRQMIEDRRKLVALAVNAGLTMLYWEVGRRINQEILKGDRADYGKEILATLSQELSGSYGNGFSYSSLTRMVKFYESFPDEKIVATLSQQLSWSHFRELLPLEKPMQRDFYAEMCRVDRWSVRTLRQKIDSMLYERTAISKKPEEVIRHEIDSLRSEDRLTPDLIISSTFPRSTRKFAAASPRESSVCRNISEKATSIAWPGCPTWCCSWTNPTATAPAPECAP